MFQKFRNFSFAKQVTIICIGFMAYYVLSSQLMLMFGITPNDAVTALVGAGFGAELGLNAFVKTAKIKKEDIVA